MSRKAKKIISNVAESVLDSAENQVKQTASAVIDQVGLASWLYGKPPSEAQVQQVTAAEQGNKAQLKKIEDEVRSMAQKGGPDTHTPSAQAPDAKSAAHDQTPGQQKSESEQRMVIEHHQEAERLGQDRTDQKKAQEQQEEEAKEQEKAEKKEVKKQSLDTPVEVQGKAKSGMARKKNKTKMMIKQMQTTKTERKSQGVGG